jgi:pimeloyl-ACP methyl ester carboxylesterase
LTAPGIASALAPARGVSSASDAEVWHYREVGSGRPLVLLHGIGMSHAAWNAVTPYLSPHRRVIAFDIAGFGLTPPISRGVPPTVAHLVDALERSIRALAIDVPVDIAGNSLGGYMALEAAARGLARGVVAISPAGLWRKHPPRHVRYVFAGMRFMAVQLPRLTRALVRVPWVRETVLAVPLSVGSRRMPARDAIRAVDDLARPTAFEATFQHTRTPFSGRITVPVTVAFGNQDWILPTWTRTRAALPPHSVWIEKDGWGHVPMWAHPRAVAGVILEGTR